MRWPFIKRCGLLRQILTRIFIVAALVNAPWEVAQSGLYVEQDGGSIAWWHCAFMGLGDGVLVLGIFFIGRIVLGRLEWFEHPGLKGYATMLVSGLAISVATEWMMVYVAHRWGYTESMPLIPGLGVGITPIAQMLILPPFVFWVVGKWHCHTNARAGF
ncbi:MAG TPA: hypothetical protein VJ746_06790 [Nitrospira sp.]|nr:hypothetical protein [Nitrospira sp.]